MKLEWLSGTMKELSFADGVFFSTKNQRSKTSRNPRTGEKVIVMEKKGISFKMSKDLFNEINNE